jgi:hypothetical protein
MKIWLDDKRPMPKEFDTHCVSAFEAIDLIKTGKVTKIGLDHDLGSVDLVGNGHIVSDYIEEAAYFNSMPRLEWSIQSSNGPEVLRMKLTLERADIYWNGHESKTNSQTH